jgi:uncharacterized protein (DUF1499 family)
MRVFALLISFIFPACAGIGADGVPVPPPIDFSHLARPTTHNTALAAPAGFSPAPDMVTRHYEVTPDQLYSAITAVASAQPRTYPQVNYDSKRQAHFVARSAWWNFPDLIAVQVQDNGSLILWSRSIYGQSDLGVNAARLKTWLAALDARLATQ